MSRLSRIPGEAIFAHLLGLILFVAATPGAEVVRVLPRPQPSLQTVSPFTITGFIQKATVDAAGDVFSGGTVKVNGILVTIPRNTLLQMPAVSMTWAEVFTLAPPPYAGTGQSGLAMSDSPPPRGTYEITVMGNRIIRSATDDKYIAGLVFISQQSPNTTQGFINAIDYVNGELLVGATPGAKAGARVRINDPIGRFGIAHSPDVRFSVDEENPTIAARTGFPMCIPRTDPAASDDPMCPQANRPVDPVTKAYQTIYTMPPPGPGLLPTDPHATQQTPFEVGDYITYLGILAQDPDCTVTAPNDCQYIAAHTITANLGIFTAPGTMPVYLRIEQMLVGVAGLPNPLFPQEAVEKLRVDAFSTDPSALVDIYALDVDACGKRSDRFYASADPFGPPAAGALKGRARIQSFMVDLLPATREIRVVSRTFTNGLNPDRVLPTAKTYANGLIAGQFHAPNFTFIFPENLVVGSPPVPLPLQEFPFLANGSGPYFGARPVAGAAALGNLGQLSPWPGLTAPLALGCGPGGVLQAPTANAGNNQTVNSGASVILDGSASSDPNVPPLPLSFTWLQTGGPPVALQDNGFVKPFFTAPVVPAGAPPVVLIFSLVVSNGFASSGVSTVSVTVSGPQPPVVDAGAPQTVSAQSAVTLSGSAVDPNGAAGLPLAFQWAQTAGPPVILTKANTPAASFNAPVMAVAQAPLSLSFTLTVTDKLGLHSAAATTVTVQAAPQIPLANAGAPQSVSSGAAVTLNGSGIDSNGSTGLPLAFQWVQTAGTPVTLATADTATASFTAPTMALGQAAQALTFTLTVTNKLGLASPPAITTVTVLPIPDVVTIASAVYSQTTTRLQVTAASTITNGLPVLTLQIPGHADVVLGFDPASKAYSAAGGVTLTSPPATVSVTSSFGGSATSPVTKTGTAPAFPPDTPGPPGSLKLVPAPLPPNLADFVVDKKTAIVLGKAFFWDQQAGSDGLACGSCHFHAGADNRVRNQLSPGLRNERGAPVSQTFNLTASNRSNPAGPPPGGGPNYTLKMADFPYHQLTDPRDRNSAVAFDTDDVTSSQGVFRLDFAGLLPPPSRSDKCTSQPSIFAVGRTNVRQVEPRNTPTVINAIYNFRSFFDGRANNIFNGRNPFGPRDTTAGVDPLNSIMVADSTGALSPIKISIPDASLASQSTGPALSDLEMSCRGRVFEQVGRKLLQRRPLDGQIVDPTDSVLGSYADAKSGLTIDYPTLIKRAFQPRFWNSPQLTVDGYSQMEKNFSLFWGLSLMLYESTLVSDDAPFDRYASGDTQAMTQQQVDGFLQVFMGKGGCVFCHKGAEFTGAASALRVNKDLGALVEHMIMGDGTVALYDSGFYNIGVRPPGEDIGAGGLDPFGNPLSWARQAKNASVGTEPVTDLLSIKPDGFNVFTCNFQVDACSPVNSSFRDAVDGSFKVPSLRNVELTGPYFHNGGQATLEQVVDFYNRGGDAAGTDASNTTGYGPNPTNRAPAILPLHLTATDKANLVEFLKALTDDRVRWEKAPFDHPSLQVPNGHSFNELQVIPNADSGQAVDDTLAVPAVGAAGRAAKKLGPLLPFEAGLQQ